MPQDTQKIWTHSEAYGLSIWPNYFRNNGQKTTTRLPPENNISQKCFGRNRGLHKADRAETWGDLFGPALPVIRPGHFMSFTNREARSGKQYITIYMGYPPEIYLCHRHTIPRKISARENMCPGYTKYIRVEFCACVTGTYCPRETEKCACKCTCMTGKQFPVKYLPGQNVPWLYKLYTDQKCAA